jgi:succinate-acetate transporter protein
MTTAHTQDTNAGGRRGEPPEDTSAEWSFWREHSTISLQPIAAPSILGLFGFAVSTFMVAANMAGWFGNTTLTPLVLFPFAFAFGGIAQLLAAMWSYRARDALATGIHGAWGSFWIGYGLYMLLVALHLVPGAADNPEARVAFGYWFVGLAAVTWTGFAGACAENAALSLVLLTLAGGSTLLAIGMVAAFPRLITIGAIVLAASAVLAWYTGSAMLLAASFGRVVLPIGTRDGPQAPGAIERRPVQFRAGEPGIKRGQ